MRLLFPVFVVVVLVVVAIMMVVIIVVAVFECTLVNHVSVEIDKVSILSQFKEDIPDGRTGRQTNPSTVLEMLGRI